MSSISSVNGTARTVAATSTAVELYRNRAAGGCPRCASTSNVLHAYADVIVAAASNAKRARQEYRVSDDALLTPCATAFALCLLSAMSWVAKLVLGCFGAARTTALTPRQWPSSSARSSRRATSRSSKVFFAVPSTRWDQDFAKVRARAGKLPRAQRVYAQVAARAAAAPVPPSRPRLLPRTTRDDDDWQSTCNR